MNTSAKDKIETTLMHLNDLTEINNDRIIGYEKLISKSDDQDLIMIFTTMAALSRSFKSDLIKGITLMGGFIHHRAEYAGQYHRVWNAIHAAVENNNKDQIIFMCEQEEKITLSIYAKVLTDKDNFLTHDMKRMVEIQKNELEFAYGRLSALSSIQRAYKN
jgi:uncharacterized protein (TIGR02284 family)